MKKIILIIFLLFITSSNSLAEEKKETGSLYEFQAGAGYIWGDLNDRNIHDNFLASNLFLHWGFKLKEFERESFKPAILDLGVEPFITRISRPQTGVETGFNLIFKYTRPLFYKLSAYGEIGAGPEYLGIKTVEEGHAGFNFLVQFGAGIKYFFAENRSLNLGYRLRHISHGYTRDNGNLGIDVNSLIAGMSVYY